MGNSDEQLSRSLRPAERVEDDPKEGWRGTDLTDDERVDDDFIAENAARVYDPLLPEDEKLFPPTTKGSPDGA